MAIREEVQSDLAIPPGEYLEEVIAELGMTKTELAKRMNRSAPNLSAMFTGAKAIQHGAPVGKGGGRACPYLGRS